MNDIGRNDYKCHICCVCFGGFTQKSWDERHTSPYTGEDCHARCCEAGICREERRGQARLRRELKAKGLTQVEAFKREYTVWIAPAPFTWQGFAWWIVETKSDLAQAVVQQVLEGIYIGKETTT